jgi:hypothetical protein
MADETGLGKKAEPGQVQAQAEPELTLQQRLVMERWPISDDFGDATEVKRPEKDMLTLGFLGYADNKKIALSSSVETWKAVFTNGLALIKAREEEAKKPRT